MQKREEERERRGKEKEKGPFFSTRHLERALQQSLSSECPPWKASLLGDRKHQLFVPKVNELWHGFFITPQGKALFFPHRIESKFQMLRTLWSLNPICLRTTWEDKAKGVTQEVPLAVN